MTSHAIVEYDFGNFKQQKQFDGKIGGKENRIVAWRSCGCCRDGKDIAGRFLRESNFDNRAAYRQHLKEFHGVL